MAWNTAIPSYLIFRIIVWKWCAWSCFLWKNGGQWRPSAAIFPQKAAPHTSLSHYNTKYQITRNSRINEVKWRWSEKVFFGRIFVIISHIFPYLLILSIIYEWAHLFGIISFVSHNLTTFTIFWSYLFQIHFNYKTYKLYWLLMHPSMRSFLRRSYGYKNDSRLVYCLDCNWLWWMFLNDFMPDVLRCLVSLVE